MATRTLEKLLVVILVSYIAVFFIYNLAQNPQLLDLSVPLMAGLLFVLWVGFEWRRQH